MPGKNRTINELHDSKIGHRKFAKICDILVSYGYNVEDIKEYYEKFKFSVDGFECEYQKQWKSSAKAMADYFKNLIETKKQIANKDFSGIWRS